MGLTVESLVRIASAGGGLIIDCKGYTVPSLERIAAASSSGEAKVIFTNTIGYSIDSLVRISAAGNGNVIIDTRST